MGNYYFVSPLTGHDLVKDFHPFDFRFWVNETTGTIVPILGNTMEGKDWTPILASGTSNWLGDKGKAMACGELKLGKGVFRICELQLANKLNANPPAALFLSKLLNINN